MSPSAAAIHLLFFSSGFTALVYEVLWERSLRLVFGVSSWSVAIVTAAFMGGLAIGYATGRLPILRRIQPLRTYAAAEAAIGLYALAFPALLGVVDSIYLASGGSIPVRATLAFLLLVPPAAAMGVTLPVVSRALDSGRSAGRVAGSLYAVNTMGAVFGALAAGWYLLRLLGAAQTTWLTTAANLTIAGIALALSFVIRRPTDEPPGVEAPPPERPAGETFAPRWEWSGIAVMFAAFTAGFLTMGLQVVWNRTLVCVVENNTTSFSLILAAVLIGSAGGAFLYSVAGGRRPLTLFATAGIFVGLYVVGSIAILNRLYGITSVLQEAIAIRDVGGLLVVRLAAVLLPVAPVAAAGAFLLPALVDLLRGSERGRAIGSVFAADAAGSVAGALVAGFVLIGLMGLAGSLLFFAFLALAAVAAVLAVAESARSRVVGLAVTGAAAVAMIALYQPLTLMRWYDGHQGIRGELLFYQEGTYGTVSVFEIGGGTRDLLINCIEEVPNHRDALVLFKVLGHGPVLLHGSVDRVLVNALGGGITLGAVILHDVDVEAVELVPEVRDAMALFAEENGNAREKPGWRLIHDDGRNHLRLARQPYDVITADATHPAAGESWPLYTREYYQIVKRHLTPGGIFAQWLPLHNLVAADFRSSLATFRAEFSDVLVLFVGRYCILLGAETPIPLDAAALTRRIEANAEVAADLAPFGIERGEDLLKYVVLDAEGLDRIVAGASLVTDDRAVVEFAELNRIGIPETFPMNLALLAGAIDPPRLARRTGLEAKVFRARERLFRAQLRIRERTLESTFAALRDLEEARVLSPRDQDLEPPIMTLRATLARHLHSEHEELLERRDLEQLLDIFDYVHQTHPEEPFFAQLLGAALLRLERWEEAIPVLERAAARRETDVTYLANLTFAYERAERYAEALRTLDRIRRLEPGNPAYEAVRRRLETRLEAEEERAR